MTEPDDLRLVDTGAIFSPLYGQFLGDRQLRKLIVLAVTAACSFFLLLALYPVLMTHIGSGRGSVSLNRKQQENVASYAADMRRSMSGPRGHPCDDFYGFICSHWPETHPHFEHQFHLADNRVKVATLERLLTRTEGVKNDAVEVTVAEKVDQALSLCLAEHVNRHEHADRVTLLLNSVGIDWPRLVIVSRRNTPFDFLKAFLTFDQRMGLPVFFQFLPEVDLRGANRTVLTLSQGWLLQLTQELSAKDCVLLAKVFGRYDLARRLVDIHQRVVTLASHLHQSSVDETPTYVKVNSLAEEQKVPLKADTMLEMINANFEENNHVSLGDDVFVTDGGRSSWRLAAVFSQEYGVEDAEAAAAYVSVLVLRKLAVQSSPLLTKVLGMSKYHCFEVVHDVAPHALALSMAESANVTQDIPVIHSMTRHLRTAIELSLRDHALPEQVAALKKLNKTLEIVVAPEPLMNPSVLERHYSHLPAFRAPFVASYLSAYERRASRAKATLGRPVVASPVTSHRLLSQSRWPELTRSAIYVPVADLVSPILVRGSLDASYAAVGHLIGRELVRVLEGLPSRRSQTSAHRARLECLRRRAGGNGLLDEIYADTMGLKLAMKALQLSQKYEPLEPSPLDSGWTREQQFFASSCFKWCAAGRSVKLRGLSSEVRCNEPLRHEESFRRAFKCSTKSPMGSSCGAWDMWLTG